MKARLVKLPARYMLVMGEDDMQQIEYTRSGYNAAEIAKHYGFDEIEMVDHKCLNITFSGSQSQQLSSSGHSTTNKNTSDLGLSSEQE